MENLKGWLKKRADEEMNRSFITERIRVHRHEAKEQAFREVWEFIEKEMNRESEFVERLESIIDGTADVGDGPVGDDVQGQSVMSDNLLEEFFQHLGFNEMARMMFEMPRRW